MRLITILIILLLSGNLIAQQTTKIKHEKKYDGGTPYPKHKEIFYVLKSDITIKHGSYLLKAGKRKLIEGWYDNNKKDSLWVYRPTGTYNNYVRAKGFYKDDIKVGVWEYSNKDGLEQRFDYNNDTLLFTTIEISDTVLPVKTDTGYVLKEVDSPPIFKEGESSKDYYLNSNNFYFGYNLPKDEWITSTIQFVVDTNGYVHDYKVIEGEYGEYNENSLKRVKRIPKEWIPAMIDNKPIETLWTITLKNKYLMSKW